MSTKPLVLVVVLLGCRHTNATAPSERAAVQADLRMLCTRVEARDISAWSQPVYQSRKVRELTPAVDGNDDDARCKLGMLMREQHIAQCREVAKHLRMRCHL